jgi:hypothetical protein
MYDGVSTCTLTLICLLRAVFPHFFPPEGNLMRWAGVSCTCTLADRRGMRNDLNLTGLDVDLFGVENCADCQVDFHSVGTNLLTFEI